MGLTARMSLAAALLCVAALACSGCTPERPAPAANASDEGMGGAETGAMAGGAIAASRNASMTAPAPDSTSGTLEVARVLAPDDGWIVVLSTEPSGGVLGFAPLRSGENRDVAVKLASLDGRRVRVALLVDRGVRGALEFDPAQPAFALDKPVIVRGSPVEFLLTLGGWGVDADPNSALIMTGDQPAAPTVEIAYLLVPSASWIEISRVEKGVVTERLGSVMKAKGEYHRVAVPVSGARSGDQVVVTVLADRGAPGILDTAAGDPLRAVDQPWVSAGVVVSQRIHLR